MRVRSLFFLLCFLQGLHSIGQSNPFMTDRNGKPLYLRTNYIAEGSPYFNDGYRMSEITMANGTVYYNIRTKINLVEFQVEYLTDDGKEMMAIVPIKKVKYSNVPAEDGKLENVTLANYDDGINAPNAKIYQVIDSGKITLLKKITITYRDDKKYSEASITRIFDRKEMDYALLPTGEFIKIEKGKPFIVELLKDKKDQITTFIDKNNLKCKSPQDFQQVVHYYNSL